MSLCRLKMEVYNCCNLIETFEEFSRVVNYLIKDLGIPKFCLDLQVKHT